MYYGLEINEGKDLNENIFYFFGCYGVDGRGRFVYDLYEILWVWGFGWEGGRKICGFECGGLLWI